MNESATGNDATLLFEWAPPKGEKLLISVFLVGSLLLHALAFYLFRIIYPPAIALLPPPARVSLISSGSEDGRTLLRWIQAEDPALASATIRPPELKSRALPQVGHVPSYVVQEPKLQDAPPFQIPLVTPDAFPPGPARVFGQAPPAPWPKIPSRVSLSDNLATLGPLKLAPMQFNASTGEPPESVRFRIGVDPQGEIRHCFRLSSSGDSALDEQARLWLVRSRFANSPPAETGDSPEQQLSWGVATVEWGNDVIHPRSTTPPTP